MQRSNQSCTGFSLLPFSFEIIPFWFWNKKQDYQNEPKFKGVYLQNNLPKTMNDWAYIINLDEFKLIETHWIACKW